MKKKLLLLSLMIMIFAFVFAISASASYRNYSSYEVVSNGERITVYAICDDIGNGRTRIDETVYTEKPEDTEGTYATLDWSTVTEIDFTNSKIYHYTNNAYVERTHGTNGTTKQLFKGWSDATRFASVKVVKLQSIVSVSGSCFTSWSGLETVYFGTTLTNVADEMFKDSTVKSLVFAESSSITKLFNRAFWNCDNIESVELPTGMTDIGSNVFYDCDNLTSVKWPADFHKIGDGMFNSCDLLEFDIPSHITYIGGSAFHTCPKLTSVVIPSGVTYIGSDCWRGCSNVTSIVFEEGCAIENIYAHTFHGTGITEITLPNTVKQLKQNVFNSCNKLVKINLGAGFTDFNLEGNAAASLNCSSDLQILVLSNTFTADAVRNGIFGQDTETNNGLINRHYSLVVLYTGDYNAASAIVTKGATGGADGAMLNGFFGSMTLLSIDEYNEAVKNGTLETGAKGTPKRYLVYDYNKCDAFYNGIHTEKLEEGEVDTNPCVITLCAKCNGTGFDTSSDSTHDIKTVIAYVNGFNVSGTKTTSCQHEGCVYNTSESAQPVAVGAIFTGFGISTRIDDGTDVRGIVFTMLIDKDLLASYEESAGARLSFGVLATFATVIGESNPLNNTGAPILDNGIVATNIASRDIYAIDLVIKGTKALWEEQAYELDIYMLGYTVENNVVTYMGTVNGVETASTSVSALNTTTYKDNYVA